MKILFVNTQLSTKETSILSSQFFYKSKIFSKLGFESFYFGSDRSYLENSDYSFMNKLYGYKGYEIFFGLSTGGFSSLFYTTIKLRKFFKLEFKKHEFEFVYFRNCIDYFVLGPIAKKNGVKIIYDSRSILSSEVGSKKGYFTFFKYTIIKFIEFSAIKKADFLFVVSNNMSKWILENLKRKSDLVIPCTCDTKKFIPFINDEIKRENLGWSESDIVIVYSGGLGHWQRVEDIIKLFSNISNLDTRYKLLFLCNDLEKAKLLFENNNIPSDMFFLEKVPHSDIPSWLNIADYSLVLRNDDLLNKVSSPVKVAEYLACGLPIIYTRNIGDYSDLIDYYNAGILYEESAEKLHLSILKNLFLYKEMSENALKLSRKFSKSVELDLLKDFLKGGSGESS